MGLNFGHVCKLSQDISSEDDEINQMTRKPSTGFDIGVEAEHAASRSRWLHNIQSLWMDEG